MNSPKISFRNLCLGFLILGAFETAVSGAYFTYAPDHLQPHLANGLIDPYGFVPVFFYAIALAAALSVAAGMVLRSKTPGAGGSGRVILHSAAFFGCALVGYLLLNIGELMLSSWFASQGQISIKA